MDLGFKSLQKRAVLLWFAFSPINYMQVYDGDVWLDPALLHPLMKTCLPAISGYNPIASIDTLIIELM